METIYYAKSKRSRIFQITVVSSGAVYESIQMFIVCAYSFSCQVGPQSLIPESVLYPVRDTKPTNPPPIDNLYKNTKSSLYPTTHRRVHPLSSQIITDEHNAACFWVNW